MAPIATYVFLDLGTTGLPASDTDITEIHMIAIKCDELRRYFRDGGKEHFAKPPAKRKLHCRLEDDVMWLIGKEDCEECELEVETAAFLRDLEKPLCLIAHNGNKFDFPLLRSKLTCVKGFSPKGIICADTFAAFYDILEPDSLKTSYLERLNGSFPWPDYHYDRVSYRLIDVFKRVLCRAEAVLEDAEDRNKALAHVSLTLGFEFMLWVAENNQPFASFWV